MRAPILHAGWTLVVACVTGCGTINNTIVGTPPAPPNEYTPPLQVYGGVRSDLRDAFGIGVPPPQTFSEALGHAGGSVLSLADVPFSAIGDTLTLGQTIPAARQRRATPMTE